MFGLERCPQCGVANPYVTIVGDLHKHYKDTSDNTWWQFTCNCSKCSLHALYYGHSSSNNTPSQGHPKVVHIQKIYPAISRAAEEIPDLPQKYLQQAIEPQHAPDGAVMLAASAIDSMLKDQGYKEGALYSRIEQASNDHLLTKQMKEWAHEIRLSANEQRHADEKFAGSSADDAKQVIEFTKALAEYLYVLPARVLKWKASAQAVS